MSVEKSSTSQSFIDMEHEVIEFWETNDCFNLLRRKNELGPVFRFIDGPITANNPMGIHHAWGRTLKDVFLRYKAMNGHSCHYRNGFDAQGLWVEVEVEKELGFKDKRDIEAFGMDKFTRKCVERIEKFSEIITEQSKRLGQWMDWDNSYYTHTDGNISAIWAFLRKCHTNGWIGQSFRPMPWCPRCGTSLSEHEMSGSYRKLEHLSIYAKLPLKGQAADILVWTTTPWTLAANVALAVNPEIEYAEVKLDSAERPMILAKKALGLLDGENKQVLRIFKGVELVGMEYETCFPELPAQASVEHRVVAWAEVDADEGTGVVHIAPGCGAEDFALGKELGLAEIAPIDEVGAFLPGFGWLSGLPAQQVADLVAERLTTSGRLFKTQLYEHSYPVCWRCKTEILFRLVREWYIRTDEIRPALLAAAETVKWEPEHIGKRMADWLTNMGDWNISRKRYYGLPLPFYPCAHCGELTVAGSVDELAALGGDISKLPELHRPWIDEVKINCPKCGNPVARIPDVGDVWLDAGIVPFSTLGYFEDKDRWAQYFPVEWVTEMREQVRLWFYSQLFMSVVLVGRAPYERVLAYNSVVAEDGSMFSKTGFMIQFSEAAEKIGVDAIRYLYAGANTANDVRFGYGLGDEARRKLLAFWNIYQFFKTYADLDKPELSGFEPPAGQLTVTDRWLLARNEEFVAAVVQEYEKYHAAGVIKIFDEYVDDVSNWYVRINRRRFWKADEPADKITAYYCLFSAIKTAVQVMAPIIPFMTESIWQNTVRGYDPAASLSVHLNVWPETNSNNCDPELLARTDKVRKLIALALRLRNEQQLKLRQPLQSVFIVADRETQAAAVEMTDVIKEELNVKEVVCLDSSNDLNEYYLALDFKTAGAVLKKDVQLVKKALEEFSVEQMRQAVARFEAGLALEISGREPLSVALFVKNARAKSGIVVAVENNVTVALDTVLSEQLVLEGLLRDILRQCQVYRKELGLQIEQRIELGLRTDSPLLKRAVAENIRYIAEETLADAVSEGQESAELSKELTIGGAKIIITIARVSNDGAGVAKH
ncbi:MAG: isoleucine--tRNA ligase [Bacillota bacterium]